MRKEVFGAKKLWKVWNGEQEKNMVECLDCFESCYKYLLFAVLAIHSLNLSKLLSFSIAPEINFLHFTLNYTSHGATSNCNGEK